MRNIIVLLALVLAAPSAHAFGRKSNPTPAPTPSPIVTITPTPAPTISPTPAPTVSPTKGHIGLQCDSNCTASEKTKLAAAEIKANQIVQGACFKNFMLTWGLIETNNKTPAQVVDQLQTTNLTVPVHYYYGTGLFGKCNGVVGYRQPPANDLYFNECYHQYYGVCDTASNAAHEWSHAVGYDHPFNNTPTRGQTVPYAINNAFDKCCVDADGTKASMRPSNHGKK